MAMSHHSLVLLWLIEHVGYLLSHRWLVTIYLSTLAQRHLRVINAESVLKLSLLAPTLDSVRIK